MDTLFFILSKLVWALIRPATWIVIALALTVLAQVLGRARAARRAGLATLALTLAITILPLGALLLAPLESRYPARPDLSRLDGIVVLGGAENAPASAYWNMPQLNEGAERFTEALALARRFPEARVVFAGGSGRLADLNGIATSESSVAAALFAEQGLDPARLTLEGRSRNTAENAALSLGLADPQPGQAWVLVTSAFHMPRAERSFARAGWPDMIPWPVDHRTRGLQGGLGWNLAGNLQTLDVAIKEYVGLAVYGLTGR